MPKIISLDPDHERILEMCEAIDLIRPGKRSEWFRERLMEFAMEKGLEQAFEQAIEDCEAKLAQLKTLKTEFVKVSIDRELMWQKAVKHFCDGRGEPTRTHDLNWARSRKHELKLARPGKTLTQILDELTQERDQR